MFMIPILSSWIEPEVNLSNVSNEALKCIGTNLKNLRDFYIRAVKEEEEEEEEDIKIDLPLDNGIRAMLIGRVKLERLYICFSLGDLTDVGLGYVGKYGANLRFLSLACIGESDEGLIKFSEGYPKLRKLEMNCCPFNKEAFTSFVFNIQSLRIPSGNVYFKVYGYISVKQGVLPSILVWLLHKAFSNQNWITLITTPVLLDAGLAFMGWLFYVSLDMNGISLVCWGSNFVGCSFASCPIAAGVVVDG
nr:hypothetical protein [Tanacetum cinerariifolium]